MSQVSHQDWLYGTDGSIKVYKSNFISGNGVAAHLASSPGTKVVIRPFGETRCDENDICFGEVLPFSENFSKSREGDDSVES